MTFRFPIATLLAMTISTSVFAQAEEGNTALADSVNQLGDAPSEQAIQQVYLDNQEQLLDVLALLLSNDNVDPQTALIEALSLAPEQVNEIVEVARAAGVSNEVITTSALLAGLDPTVVSEATAAGIATAGTAGIARPTSPAIGGNGGGGSEVVSPN